MRRYSIPDSTLINIAKIFLMYENCTVRKLAFMVEIPKSTIHRALRTRLKFLDSELYKLVDVKLNKNKEEAPKRGGIGMANKYRKK